jgi:predicted AlkP superfamily phosphohydrolase/phosphomutase
MSFLRKLGKPKSQRVVVIGLDGTPYTFLQKAMAEGHMPNLVQLLEEGSFRRINSVYPTVSSVAWSSFMTGRNPGKHNIYGFIDRRLGTYQTYIPTSRAMKTDTLWEILSRAGKKVIVVNVPVTYPPRPVNGILVSGFLSPNVDKATYPPEKVALLKHLGYIVDADPWAARQSKDKALAEVNAAFDARIKTMFHLMDNEPWDFFQMHVMETDRLYHFLWQQMETDDPVYAPQFMAFIHKIDDMLGRLRAKLDDHTTLFTMSDHGFCTIKKEVYVNYWLEQQGWLKFEDGVPRDKRKLEGLSPESRAYSLVPGRVFVHLQGREPKGHVAPGVEYEALRDEIAASVLELTDPDTGERMIQGALKREEIYSGPHFDRAADLILVPFDGYDLKGNLGKDTLTFKGEELVGMHTYNDAALYVRGEELCEGLIWVADPMPTILSLMEVPIPADVDGQNLLR